LGDYRATLQQLYGAALNPVSPAHPLGAHYRRTP